MSENKGKLIVLDGTDGSGKSTQFKMLVERMEERGIPFAQIKFPCYESPASVLVRQYLAGEYGEDAAGVNIYAASMFYAMDRYDAWMKNYNEWREVYESGGVVIADRYTTANFIHQAAKLETLRERFRFFSWLKETEFNLFGLPEPDLVVLLNMPADKAMEFLAKRQEETGETADIHETSAVYLRNCHDAAMDAARAMDWGVVSCVDRDGVRSPEEIHEDVWSFVGEVLGCEE